MIKRNWNEFSFHTVFMKCVCFISPRQRLGDVKTHNSFHKYCMKWKFISDPIFVTSHIVIPHSTSLRAFTPFGTLVCHISDKYSCPTWLELYLELLHSATGQLFFSLVHKFLFVISQCHFYSKVVDIDSIYG